MHFFVRQSVIIYIIGTFAIISSIIASLKSDNHLKIKLNIIYMRNISYMVILTPINFSLTVPSLYLLIYLSYLKFTLSFRFDLKYNEALASLPPPLLKLGFSFR